MCFALKGFSFTLYVAFLTAILYGFAFNCTVLHVSCILLASKIYAKMFSKLLLSKFIALAKANTNAFNAITKCAKMLHKSF